MKSNNCVVLLTLFNVKYEMMQVWSILQFAGRGGACLYRSVTQVCVEKSLIFRSNTPYSTDIVSDPGGRDLLFCVQLDDSKQSFHLFCS